jgi:gamma-glutamylputrescine oxidase
VRPWLGVEGAAVLQLPGAGTLDPYLTCQAFARRAEGAGARLFERTEARRIEVGRRGVRILTNAGTIGAGTVVIATDGPGKGFGALERHFRRGVRFAVALPPVTPAVRRRFGSAAAVAADLAQPAHAWRWWRDEVLLFGGAEQAPVAARQIDKTIVQRAGRLMYELSLLHPDVSGTAAASAWSEPIVAAADGGVIAGPHRAFPRHLFALGLGRSGVNASWLAARVLARRWAGAATKPDEIFGFNR